MISNYAGSVSIERAEFSTAGWRHPARAIAVDEPKLAVVVLVLATERVRSKAQTIAIATQDRRRCSVRNAAATANSTMIDSAWSGPENAARLALRVA